MNVKIYNLNSEFINEERRNGNYYAFMSSESLEQHGLKIERCNYNLVWNHDFESETSLDELYKLLMTNSKYRNPVIDEILNGVFNDKFNNIFSDFFFFIFSKYIMSSIF